MSSSAYGTGSAFVVILLYVYYSSVILYFGAEFTQVQARRQGARIQPSKYAVRLTDEQRAQQGMPKQEQIESAEHRQKTAGQPAPATPDQGSGPPQEQKGPWREAA